MPSRKRQLKRPIQGPAGSGLRSVHVVGICGRLVAPLAIHLRECGVRVTGSDCGVFPPVSEWLGAAGIGFHREFSADHLPRRCDLVIVGGYVRRGNPELEEVLRRGLPWDNAARWMGAHLFRTGQNVLVAGTNGKTTTTAMTAHLLNESGADAGWLVGGECPSLARSFRLGPCRVRVIEADEYPSGLGDRNPKFLHYRPDALAITNIAPDHLDVYPSAEGYRSLFAELAATLPPDRLLVVSGDDPGCAELAAPTGVRLCRVGFSPTCEARITRFRSRWSGVSFRFLGEAFSLPLLGAMNARNAAMAVLLAREYGVPPAASARALARFAGPASRLERIFRNGALDAFRDDGYHPLAWRESIAALRAAFPGRRLVALFQPRYGGAGKEGFQDAWEAELAAADLVIAGGAFDLREYAEGRGFSLPRLLRGLRKRGCEVRSFAAMEAAVPRLGAALRPGDVLLVSIGYRNEAIWEELRAMLAARGG